MALTQQDIALIQQMGKQQNPDSIWDVLGNLAAQWIKKENGGGGDSSNAAPSLPAVSTPAQESAPAHQVNIDATPQRTPVILNNSGTFFPMNGGTQAPREPAQFVPEYNRITPDDDLSVVRAKNRAQGYTFDSPSILDALSNYIRR